MTSSVLNKLTLNNGLRILKHPISTTYFVTIAIAVKAGSRYEPPNKPGLAHFLEHMLFRGTRRFPSSQTLSHHLERVGGLSKGQTNRESVVYWVTVPHQQLGVAFTYLSELLNYPLLPKQDIPKERSIIREEIRTQSGWDWIFYQWFNWVWGDQPIGRTIIGSTKAFSTFTRKDLTTLHATLYHSTNMVLAIVGNFSKDDLAAYAHTDFGRIRAPATLPRLEKAIFIPKDDPLQVLHQDWQQAYVVLGFVSGIFYTHPCRFAMRVLASMLAMGSNSRLYDQLVLQRGLAYSISAESWLFSDNGLFCIYGGLSPKHLEEGVNIILHELQRLKQEPVLSHELEVAKEKDKAWMRQSLEMPQSMAEWLATSELLEDRILSPGLMAQTIDNVTPQDIQRVAQRYFRKEKLSVLVVGPSQDIKTEGLRRTIRGFDP